MKTIAMIVALAFICGCATVKVQCNGARYSSDASHMTIRKFFWWGITDNQIMKAKDFKEKVCKE